MKIQIIGYKGMLGQALIRYLQTTDSFETIVSDFDITLATSNDIQAPVVINCAGLVKQRDKSAYEFVHVNGAAPHLLAESCEKAGSRLIHVSTDCVFNKNGPHDEYSVPSFDADDIYAMSKLVGEVKHEPHLTIRTSFVGFGKHGLIADLLSGESVFASRGLLWTGHMAPTIAKVLVALASRPDVTGLLHVPGEEQTRFQVACLLSQWMGMGSVIENDYDADRRLVSRRWADLSLPGLPPFVEQLELTGHLA